MSQITSHILDTSRGKPAAGIPVVLLTWDDYDWVEISSSISNTDGRIMNLLEPDVILSAGIYRLKFITKKYFEVIGAETFYPFIEITFEIDTSEHYHVPLLLNPFGYSTYRGS